MAHRRQGRVQRPVVGVSSLGRPGTGAIADPALVLDGPGGLYLFLSRPGQEGLITLRQEVPNGPFTKGPAVPDLP